MERKSYRGGGSSRNIAQKVESTKRKLVFSEIKELAGGHPEALCEESARCEVSREEKRRGSVMRSKKGKPSENCALLGDWKQVRCSPYKSGEDAKLCSTCWDFWTDRLRRRFLSQKKRVLFYESSLACFYILLRSAFGCKYSSVLLFHRVTMFSDLFS